MSDAPHLYAKAHVSADYPAGRTVPAVCMRVASGAGHHGRRLIATAASNPRRVAALKMATGPSPSSAIDFLLLLQRLKAGEEATHQVLDPLHAYDCFSCAAQTTKRTGWVRKGVQGPESIAGKGLGL
jgi:hypothetical protein